MKKIYLGQINGYVPVKSEQYQAGWTCQSRYEKPDVLTEAEALKLLGDAMEHHERMGLAIANLRKALGLP